MPIGDGGGPVFWTIPTSSAHRGFPRYPRWPVRPWRDLNTDAKGTVRIMTHYCLTSPKKDQKSNLLSVNCSKSLSGALNTLKFISVFSLYLPIISYDKQKTLNPKLSHSRSVLRHLIGWILGLSSSHSAPHLSR